ncbi:unnamed protein product [Effrenium voratum]|nr:unnamed protein product [Effrenium voratum]
MDVEQQAFLHRGELSRLSAALQECAHGVEGGGDRLSALYKCIDEAAEIRRQVSAVKSSQKECTLPSMLKAHRQLHADLDFTQAEADALLVESRTLLEAQQQGLQLAAEDLQTREHAASRREADTQARQQELEVRSLQSRQQRLQSEVQANEELLVATEEQESVVKESLAASTSSCKELASKLEQLKALS